MCYDSSWNRIYYRSSTYVSHSNLHEHERFKDLLSRRMLATLTYMSMRDLKIYYLRITLYVHVHFRIVYFAPHYGELHVLL